MLRTYFFSFFHITVCKNGKKFRQINYLVISLAQCGKVLQNAITIFLKKDANFPSN